MIRLKLELKNGKKELVTSDDGDLVLYDNCKMLEALSKILNLQIKVYQDEVKELKSQIVNLTPKE